MNSLNKIRSNIIIGFKSVTGTIVANLTADDAIFEVSNRLRSYNVSM